jgi:AcrR family transcriptional regulator
MPTARQKKIGSRRVPPEVQRYNSIDVGSIRRKQIVDAVRKIIARDGLDAVTILNIATELGTSRGVVVYHFENKEEILHEVVSSAMTDADASSLSLDRAAIAALSDAQLILQVATLAKGSSDWWKIYFAFLSHAHVNEAYRKVLAWSDDRYRNALAKRLGDENRASIVLALMKGLAMQTTTSDINISGIADELRTLMQRWLRRD